MVLWQTNTAYFCAYIEHRTVSSWCYRRERERNRKGPARWGALSPGNAVKIARVFWVCECVAVGIRWELVHLLSGQTGRSIPSTIHTTMSYTLLRVITKNSHGWPALALAHNHLPTPSIYVCLFRTILNGIRLRIIIGAWRSTSSFGH